MLASDRKWEAMGEREIGKGGDAVLSCSVTVLIIEPLLRSKKSSYGLQTESCYKSYCVYNLIFLHNDNINKPFDFDQARTSQKTAGSRNSYYSSSPMIHNQLSIHTTLLFSKFTFTLTTILFRDESD